MDKYGIIGNPVAGSLSPRLFAAAYGGRWRYDLIEGADFDASWQRFLRSYRGINITAPFKEAALSAVLSAGGGCTVAPAAQRIGAINLAVKSPSGIAAYNTDYDGVILALKEAGVCPPDTVGDDVPTALVAGCGGAGKAAAAAVADMGMHLLLYNRTRAKAEALAALFGGEVAGGLAAAIRSADLIIYTIPQATDDLLELQEADFAPADGRPGKVVLEANYKTPAFGGTLLARLEKAGGRYISGRRWLLYQAVAGYARFTGEDPDIEKMESVL